MAAKNSRGGKASEGPWELADIRKLIDLLIERGIDEFEMEKNGLRVRIRRGSGATSSGPGLQVAPSAVLPVPATLLPATAISAPSAAVPGTSQSETNTAPRPETDSEESTEELHIVKSPMVGTFYGSPSPDSDAFVKLGDVVKVDQVLCIIEAMKLMNEIESDVAGEVVRIYVEDGQPVEYGQSLFAIKPSHKR
jgi:acetyl-CoA carboxylase biotin carboxyl carrier protein